MTTLTIIETPHQGRPRTWTAADEDAFCVAVQRSKPHGDWNPNWTFDQFREYLAGDLRSLEIERSAPDDAAAIAIEAIARSTSHTEIVTIDDAPGLRDALLVLCDDTVENDGLAEYWGTDDEGAPWRIHVRLKA